MNYLDLIFQIWQELYDKSKDTKTTIEKFFDNDYSQCINGVYMNLSEYFFHVEEQKKNIQSMSFKLQKSMIQANELFLIYTAEGKTLQNLDIDAEIISYLNFKDNKIFQINGQVRLLKGNPADMDMDAD